MIYNVVKFIKGGTKMYRKKNKELLKRKGGYLLENGITLISLVVTIIVLLILAGVTINLTIGNNRNF